MMCRARLANLTFEFLWFSSLSIFLLDPSPLSLICSLRTWFWKWQNGWKPDTITMTKWTICKTNHLEDERYTMPVTQLIKQTMWNLSCDNLLSNKDRNKLCSYIQKRKFPRMLNVWFRYQSLLLILTVCVLLFWTPGFEYQQPCFTGYLIAQYFIIAIHELLFWRQCNMASKFIHVCIQFYLPYCHKISLKSSGPYIMWSIKYATQQ